MIVRIWGYDTVPPMTYPGLVKRVPCVVGLGPLEGEAIWCSLDHPQAGVKDAEADKRTWYVVLGYDDERLGYWRPIGVELTTTPIKRLWGPGSWDELRGEVDASAPRWPTDAVDILDRLFYIRVKAIRLSCPDPRKASGRCPPVAIAHLTPSATVDKHLAEVSEPRPRECESVHAPGGTPLCIRRSVENISL